MWSAGVLARYWILQFPEAAVLLLIMLLLQQWLVFPTWVTWTALGVWVAKDAALYPWTWRSYDPDYPVTLNSLDGAHGVATERLDPAGYVRVRGELWYAELDCDVLPVEKDAPVRVRTRRGLTVIVAAADPAPPEQNGTTPAKPPGGNHDNDRR